MPLLWIILVERCPHVRVSIQLREVRCTLAQGSLLKGELRLARVLLAEDRALVAVESFTACVHLVLERSPACCCTKVSNTDSCT